MSGAVSASAATAATLAEAAAADATFTGLVGATAAGTSAVATAASVGSTWAALSTAAQLASGVVGAAGAIKSGMANSATAKYQSQVAANNAKIATQNADMAGKEGAANIENQQLKTRAQVGSIAAAQGANGLDINSGSNVDVRSSAAELGELNAINIGANAARQAYGFQTESAAQTGQSQLDKKEAGDDLTSGYVNAGSTLLGAVGSSKNDWNSLLGNNSIGVA